MVRHTGIVEDLRLDECGLTYLDMDPWGFAPFGDPTTGEQQAITFHVDLDTTCDSIAALCGDRDADAYRAFVKDWGARNEAVFEAFQDVPTAGRLGRHLWGAGKAARRRRAGDVAAVPAAGRPAARRALRRRAAQDRAVLARRAVRPADARGRDRRPGRLERPACTAAARPRGRRHRRADRGPRRTAPTARAAPSGSATAPRAITRERRPGHRRHHRVRRPRPRPRRRRRLPRPHHARAARRRGAARAARPRRSGSATASAWWSGSPPPHCPRYPASADAPGVRRTPRCSCSRRAAPSSAAAYGDFVAGRTPTEPAVLVMTPTALDPSIAPPGKHVVTAWAQWHPYELSTGEHWDDIREREGDRIVAQVERAAPGFTEHDRAACTCRRRSTWSASSACGAATSCTSRWGWTRCSPTGRCPSWRVTVRRCAASSSPARRRTRAAACSARPAARRPASSLAQPAAVAMTAAAYAARDRRRPARRPPAAVAGGSHHSGARRSPTRWSTERGCDRVTDRHCGAFAAPASLHALVHRGPALGPRPGRRHRRRRPRGRGRRGAHRPAVRRLLLRAARSGRSCSTCRSSCRWPGR